MNGFLLSLHGGGGGHVSEQIASLTCFFVASAADVAKNVVEDTESASDEHQLNEELNAHVCREPVAGENEARVDDVQHA